MKYFFTLLLFLLYITAYGQAFCYPFGRQKMSPFNINNGNCYDFNKRNPSGSGFQREKIYQVIDQQNIEQ